MLWLLWLHLPNTSAREMNFTMHMSHSLSMAGSAEVLCTWPEEGGGGGEERRGRRREGERGEKISPKGAAHPAGVRTDSTRAPRLGADAIEGQSPPTDVPCH